MTRRLQSSRKREFPCPHCQRPVVVFNVDEKGSATLRHPKNGCKAPAGDILRAYVLAMRPRIRFPKMEDVAEKLWDRYQKDKNG